MTNVLHSKATEIDERFNHLTARREAILRERQQEQITDNDIDSMVEFSRDVSKGLTNPTPQQQHHWLELLQTKVTVVNSQITIACLVGKQSGTTKNFEQFQAQATPDVLAANPKI